MLPTSLDNSSIVANSQIVFPDLQPQPPVESEHIIILKQPELVIKEEEVHPQNLQELIGHLHQLVRFPLSADPEKVDLLPAQLNEALQKEPCFRLEHYQVRILQLKQMLADAERLPEGDRLCSVLKQHLIHVKQAASVLHRDSATPVQDSLWPLYERILRLPTLEPDFFGAAVATLHEKLPNANSFDPLVEQLQALLPKLLPPAHYLWGQPEPFTEALQKLEEIKLASLALVHRLKNAPDGYMKTFCAPMESIYETYRDFLEEFTRASEQKRAELCIPKAQLSGIGLGFFSLTQAQGRALLCRDSAGNVVKKNALGSHANHQEAGVFYKPNPEGRSYIGPEMEFAVYAFYEVLGHKGAAPTCLAKIRHLFFEGQPTSFGRVLQAGYGIEGISLQDILGMANILPFLERCWGLENSQNAFKELLKCDFEKQYTEANPNISENALSYLSLDEVTDYLIQKFEAFFEPLDADKRCVEFAKIPVPNSTKFDIRDYILAHSTKELIGALALLHHYPNLNLQQTSFTELGDFCHYLHKIPPYFPTLTPEQLPQELSHLMTRFDPTDFSAHFVATLMTNPYDHKPDNLMVTVKRNEQGGVDSLSLVGIDNDYAFATSEEDVRSILYLMEPMNAPLDPTIAQRILDTTAEELVFDWLVALEEQNQNYHHWQKQGILSQKDLFEDGEPSLHIPLKIDANLIPTIYAKARLLRDILFKNDPSLTHWDLLKALQPKIAQAYEKALNTSKTLEDAYKQIPNSFSNQVKPASHEVLQQIPAEAALSFLNTVDLSSFPLKLQVSLIGKTLRTFPAAARNLKLPGEATQPLSRREFFLLAAKKGHHALVARLLEEEKKSRLVSDKEECHSLVEMRNQEEQTALLIACCRLDVEMIRLLIHYGADPQVYDIGGRSALALCLVHLPDAPERAARAVRFLGDHSDILFNAARGHRGWTPLHHLVETAFTVPEEAEPLVAYLIEKGATPDLVDNKGKTALDHAIELGQERVVMQLIHLGAGRTLNIREARAFFNSRPHLAETFQLLQRQSLLLRWHLALEALRHTNGPGPGVAVEGIQLGKITLPVDLAKELLDEQGDIKKPEDQYGRRNVHKLVLPGRHELYFKQYPEMPGVEYAIDKLFELLIGQGTSFTDLAKLTLPNGKSYPVLISQGIQGENLHDVLSDPVKTEQLDKLDPLAFSELLLASLLVNFEDAKPDNFILELQPGGSYRLVGIDNDHAFVPPLMKEDDHTVQVKCILYCLNMMKQPIHAAARERFLSFTPERLLRLWLKGLEEQNENYCVLFPEKERRKLFKETKKSPGMVIPIPFRPRAITDLYQKFQRLQIALKESPQITGMELLRLVIPSLGIRYEEAFHTYNDPLNRFLSLTGTQYSTAIVGRLNTLMNSKQMLKSMAITEKAAWNIAARQGPTQALQELDNLQKEMQLSAQELRNVRNALQAGDTGPFERRQLNTTKEKVINGVPGEFEGLDFSAMEIPVQRKVLTTVLKGHYRSLKLRGCAAFDNAALDQLLRNSPQLLSLELRECPEVSEEMLAQLWEAGYLCHLHLNTLPQLKRIILPHPTLRRLQIVNCQGLARLEFSDTLKSLSIDACWNLSLIYAGRYVPAVSKLPDRLKLIYNPVRSPNWLRFNPYLSASDGYVCQNLHLKACPKLELWEEMFGNWLKESKTHQIQLQNVDPMGYGLSQVVKSALQHPEAKKLLASLSSWSLKKQGSYSYGGVISEANALISFYERYQPSFLLKELDLSKYPEIVENGYLSDMDVLPDFVRKCPNLTSVNLSGVYGLSDGTLQALAQGCPNLTQINLACCRQITDTGLQALAQGCPNLTSINLSEFTSRNLSESQFGKGEGITDRDLEVLAQGCPNLTQISLAYCIQITDAGLQALAQGCPNLTFVNLAGCFRITTIMNHRQSLSEKSLELPEWSIRSRSFNSCSGEDDSLEGPEGLKNEEPDLQYLLEDKSITVAGLQELAQGCQNPTSVDLNTCWTIAKVSEQSTKGWSTHANLPYKCYGITDAGLQALANGCQNLAHVDLSGCLWITDTGLQALANTCPNLSHVSLRDCKQITDTGLQLLAQGCPNLSHVSLGGCKQITDAGLQAFAQDCPNLTSVDMTACWITDTGLQALVNGCPNLTTVTLAGCYKITDAGLQALVNGCPNLTSVDLRCCVNITQSGLQVLTQDCPNLISVVLPWSMITDAELQALVNGCPNLTSVYLPFQFFDKVIGDVQEKLKERYPIIKFG